MSTLTVKPCAADEKFKIQRRTACPELTLCVMRSDVPTEVSDRARIVQLPAMSAVSLYYYLQVLKRIYIADPPPESTDAP